MASPSRFRLLVVVWLASLTACSSGLPTFGEDLFPAIDPSVLERYCIRGAAVNSTELGGEIATTDCDKGPGFGYWDAYRIRVTVDAAFAFEAMSDFDSELELFRIDYLDDYWASRVQLAFDEDSGEGQDAIVSQELVPQTEYLLIVSGADDFSRGAYTVRITGSP